MILKLSALSAPGSQRFERSFDQSERRRIRRMPRAERGPPARAREDTPCAGRATGDACIDVTRVCPGRGAPTFASARRRGAGEAARQCVSSNRRKEEWWDLERRDARAGSEAPKARCTGRVRSAEGVRVRSAEGAMHGQRAGSEA